MVPAQSDFCSCSGFADCQEEAMEGGIKIVSLPPVTPALRQLTFPAYGRMMAAVDRRGMFFAAAERQGLPLGLVLVRERGGIGELLSVMVRPGQRRRGIARRLLEVSETWLKKLGCRLITTSFAGRLPAVDAFRGLLAAAGFSEPEPFTELYRFDLLGKFSPVFKLKRYLKYHRLADLPEPFTAGPWCRVPGLTRKELAARVGTPGWYEEWENPFRDERMVDSDYSLALWHGKEVAGWVVSHRLRPDTLRFTHVFCREEYQKTGIIMALLVYLFVKSRELGGARYCWLGMRCDNRAFRRLMARRFGPYAEGIDLSFRAEKGL